MNELRLIIDPQMPGAQNMAIDEALLHDAAENGVATLRFYGWSEPTLSLGYFQRFDDRNSHAASQGCAIVRRQTGGGAILHDRELTYSLCLPAAHPLSRGSEQLYTEIHEAFIAELQPKLDAAVSPWRLARHEPSTEGSPHREEPFLCFQRRARGDVVLTPGKNSGVSGAAAVGRFTSTVKILGSAQRRHRGAILQHGSLLWEKSPFAPELAGCRDTAGLDVAVDELTQSLTVRLAGSLNLHLQDAKISQEVESKAAQLANNKYSRVDWTNRR